MSTFTRRLLSGPCTLLSLLTLLGVVSVQATERQALRGHVPASLARLTPVSRLESTNLLRLSIGLPLRDRPALTTFLHQLYDPASAQYRRYLTPAQFAERFGPSRQDYQAVIAFAKAGGLSVAGIHSNRLLLSVQGTVADLERTFHLKMQVYPHPTEPRNFYAPDREPSVELATPILHVSGFDNYTVPHPMYLRERTHGDGVPTTPRDGSGPNGEFAGKDFRNAYVPLTALTGAGQAVGLFELSGYYASDIAAYQTRAGMAAVPLQNVLIDGFNGAAGSTRPGSPNEEVALDIEMAISMAPGLSKVLVYEGPTNATIANVDDVLNRMATDNLAKQLSCSWGFDIDENTQQIYLQYAAQGQSFYQASGDSGAFAGAVLQPSDSPYLTVVGGTSLTTDSSQRWASETAWGGSSGGFSTVFPIPEWQQGIDMSLNQGSTSMRNLPDVAMVATNVLAIADQGRSMSVFGTSISAPLWAGFTALVNQRAAAQGKPPVGFLNPALYAVGKGSGYSSSFHDITAGNNANANSPNLFPAVPGFDLVTGWGTPRGTNLIESLLAASPAGLAVTPPLGFLASGPVGGPFKRTSESYTIANAGPNSLSWIAANNANWLDVQPNGGTLPPGGTATVTVMLNSNANSFLLSSQSAIVSFTDLGSGNHQDCEFALSVGNGGFETGDFTYWTLNGQDTNNFADSVDATQVYGSTIIPGVDDSQFVHSGIYGAFLGQYGSLGHLSQTLPTVAGQRYVLSFWVANPAQGTPNEFGVSWNGTTLFDQADMDQFGWANQSYVVAATSDSTVLQFLFQNDQNAFALDDVSVVTVPAPAFTSVQETTGTLLLSWNSVPGISYQVQYAQDPYAGPWTSLGTPITATDVSTSLSDNLTTDPQRFYRIVLSP